MKRWAAKLMAFLRRCVHSKRLFSFGYSVARNISASESTLSHC